MNNYKSLARFAKFGSFANQQSTPLLLHIAAMYASAISF
jgi:hypothetical protein